MSEKPTDILLQVDDRIQVTIKGADEETPTIYFSRVEDIRSGSYLIEWPIKRGVLAPVKDRDVLLISINDRGSAYGTEARVLARVQKPIPLLKVQLLDSALKKQMRQFLRLPASIDVELVARVTDGTIDGNQPASPAFIVTNTVTLGGGGFSIHYSGALPLGALYHVKLTIPTQQEPLEAGGQGSP